MHAIPGEKAYFGWGRLYQSLPREVSREEGCWIVLADCWGIKEGPERNGPAGRISCGARRPDRWVCSTGGPKDRPSTMAMGNALVREVPALRRSSEGVLFCRPGMMGREAVIEPGLVISWLVMTASWGHRSQVMAFTTRSLEAVITRKTAKLREAAQGIRSSGALKVFNSIRWA